LRNHKSISHLFTVQDILTLLEAREFSGISFNFVNSHEKSNHLKKDRTSTSPQQSLRWSKEQWDKKDFSPLFRRKPKKANYLQNLQRKYWTIGPDVLREVICYYSYIFWHT
jgi:hypothetical protein